MELERAISAFQSLDINRKDSEGPSRVPTGLSSASRQDVQPSDEEVLHDLARTNGAINKMSEEELQKQLQTLGLNTGGVREILRKRLKNYHKRQKIYLSKRLQREDEKTPFDFLVVIDYEATCGQNNDNFVHEIIEFPAVLIDVRTCATIDSFQMYCKPTLNPQLTKFCRELTGITQSQVDEAKDFKEVFSEFVQWMKSKGLGEGYKFAIVTDGPWDMARFLKIQTDLSDIKFPNWAKKWINLRKCYSSFYNVRRLPLKEMLDELDMVFQGRPHCGLDDAKNIAAIAICLLQDGCTFKHNEYLHEHRHLSHSSQARPAHRSKPSHTQTRSRKKSPVREHIAQEGENLDDLLFFAKLKVKAT